MAAKGPFLAIFGHFPDMPWPDQTLIKFNQLVWSLPGELWHQKVIFGHFWPFFAIFGHIGGLWHPPEAFLDPGKGPNTLPQMCPGQIKPWSFLINQFGASKVTFVSKRSFWLFFCHFWPFLATLTAYGAPQRPSRTQEKAQTCCPRRVLAGSNLDQVWSTIFGPPGRLTVKMAILVGFWPFFCHKWFKMTRSRWAARWSRSNSTPMSAPVSQFSPKDNFLNTPPLKHTVLRLAKYAKSPKSNMAV